MKRLLVLAVIDANNKVHFAPMLDEHPYLTGGDEVPVLFEINDIKASQITCYDLRFSKIKRLKGQKSYSMLHN
ncbi:hypothetical protein P4310_21900 [Bacillus thuringiensis]|uniref:hypothetical protein n=1 Tax=Bacillus thuringiensis TaxID=1428 RepID=UPI000B677739|nr:hypothetical protein [Bacillus thuringiensis]MDY8164095.1 hypothetical protein [Bacillus thuringiensis]MED3068144.1 hypothetical protein [Bacillus thuringiensis]OUB32358.1 hypothetical protein BK737_13755 [Bacillus thuringiensis serovar palmanyolensis]